MLFKACLYSCLHCGLNDIANQRYGKSFKMLGKKTDGLQLFLHTWKVAGMPPTPALRQWVVTSSYCQLRTQEIQEPEIL